MLYPDSFMTFVLLSVIYVSYSESLHAFYVSSILKYRAVIQEAVKTIENFFTQNED